jgi:hypothetical protein
MYGGMVGVARVCNPQQTRSYAKVEAQGVIQTHRQTDRNAGRGRCSKERTRQCRPVHPHVPCPKLCNGLERLPIGTGSVKLKSSELFHSSPYQLYACCNLKEVWVLAGHKGGLPSPSLYPKWHGSIKSMNFRELNCFPLLHTLLGQA